MSVKAQTPPTTPLGRIVWEFRGAKHLSKRAAAEVLGVSYVYVNSLEAGVDIRTNLPFTPREATLRQLAAKMAEAGYPMTYEELARAAEDRATDQEQQPASHGPLFTTVEQLREAVATSHTPPTEDEFQQHLELLRNLSPELRDKALEYLQLLQLKAKGGG